MDKTALKTIHLFSDLTDDEIEKVYAHSHLKTFDKGEMIFFDTEPYIGFYAVIRGCVKVFKISKEGKEHIIHFVYKNDTFASAPLFQKYGSAPPGSLTYPANAMAIEDGTQAMLIYSEGFVSLLEHDRRLCFKMMATLSKRLRFLISHVEEISLNDVYKRLAHFILVKYESKYTKPENTSPGKSPKIELDVSKNDLASHLGTIYETLSRTFRKFQDENILEINGRKIVIKDLDRLKKASI